MVADSLKWTTRDLEVMPDDGGWKRYEIVDGELYVTDAPHIRHQGAANRISTRLEVWSDETGLGHAYQTPGLVFTPTDAVIPDVVWASHQRLAAGIDQAGHFIIAPELVVEILSEGAQNQQRDKEFKLKLYSLHGVQEYWIVDWQAQTIAVYRHSEGMLRLVGTFSPQDELTSPLLPGFSLRVQAVFQ
ncbi:Uma2 family endonuclease [Thermoleptolyngbya oregonensis NK1-22]|uniref:Uma2 family endonuclease n=1 Tax=Thermoleptolyngbya oregonensis NK1-22 TaxID=2547457 RepID=A0AA97BDA3_9CYAN|nr:Uma2 family endonuclease [Thermoleptolyngbya oregonensis NK1-22]